jgi:hypothetical protein
MAKGVYKRTKIRSWKVKDTSNLGWKKGRKHKDASKKKMSASKKKNPTKYWLGKERPEHSIKMSGSNCHLWRGGITSENDKIRKSREYKLWRKSVFTRDNYTCIWCGAKSKKGVTVILNADHIKPFAYFPELRLAIDNGRTLCEECHKKTDTFKMNKKLQANLRAKND